MTLNPGGVPGHAFPYAQTITLVRRVLAADKSEYGNDVYTEVPVSVSNCIVQPAGTVEDTNFADRVSQSITVFLPYGTAVGPLDALIINGEKFEIEGIPQEWRSPFSGHTSPLQVQASKIAGVSA